MSIVSNLYAEKVFAEHPIGLWTMDEKLDYISFIDETERDLQIDWTYSDATVSEHIQNIQQPFVNSIVNLIQFDSFVQSYKEIKFTGPDLENFNNLNPDIQTLCVGSYFYTDSPYLSSVSIGFEYTDSTTAEIVEQIKTYDFSIPGKWVFISNSAVYPEQLSTFRPVIKIKFRGGASSTEEYKIYSNGLSVGQDAEKFNSSSLGFIPDIFTSNANIEEVSNSIKINSYGLEGLNGYYLINNNKMLAQNTGIPLVFGSSNVTRLYHNNSLPSIIIPGLGFLNEIGRLKEYTCEMWIKINANTLDPIKIFGPISSDDGLYVESGFLTLVVDEKFESHFVGDWSRPMLIQIRTSDDNASLILNGEEVINFTIDSSTMNLPTEYTNLKSNDWLGFYANENITPFEIDSVSIYPYKMSTTMAKRRWVYGQATPTTEEIDSVHNGRSVSFDYTFSEYTSNYDYPKHGSWSQGISDNLGINSNEIYIPNYELPEIFLDGKTLDNLYLDCNTINTSNEHFVTFRPNTGWNNLNTYMRFPNFNIIKEKINAIYGVFSIQQYSSTNQILIEISDSTNYLRASLIEENILYSFYYNGSITEIYSTDTVLLNNKISVGFNFDLLIDNFGSNVLSFLGNQSVLNIYVAGNKTGLYPFTGKIHTFGICSTYNFEKIKSYFNNLGVISNNYHDELLSHIASYTLMPEKEYGSFYIDIAVSSYWQDYIPLSYFASYVKNNNDETIYDLDFLQFNVSYPSVTTVESIAQTGSWTYNDLEDLFDLPIQKQYNQLDNFLYTGWDNYQELDNKVIPTRILDTSNNDLKMYISLQFIADEANKTINQYSEVVSLEKSKVIDFKNISNWQDKVCEIIDNTLIYFPSEINFNELAIVTHCEFNVRGINTKPLKIKQLQFASRALNKNTFNKIGTRFGKGVYPYAKSGIYYDNKIQNPISIYKGSTPYLYTTNNSGIEVRNDLTEYIDKGIAIPLNDTISSSFAVNAIQLWLKYSLDLFPYGTIPVFEVDYFDDVIQFFARATSESGKKAKIFAKSKNGLSVNGIAFYLNGNLVTEPVIDVGCWNVLSVSFANSLNLDNKIGYINLDGPFAYDNISHYQATNLQTIQNIITRPWLKVLNDGFNDIYWQYWLNNYIWNGVLVLSSTDKYSTNLKDVYSSYTGTNKVVIDTSIEDIGFADTSVRVFSDVEWQSYVINPV